MKNNYEISEDDIDFYDSNIKDSLSMYLKEINEFPLLSDEEFEILFKEATKGDESAREKIINCNLRLVVFFAKKYIGRGFSLSDLIQEGNVGLMMALNNFDINKEIKFSTYAGWWIKGTIRRALQDKLLLIRIPVNIFEEINKIYMIQNELTMKLNREPSKEEIAMEMNMSVDELDRILSHKNRKIDIDYYIDKDYENDYTELLAADVDLEEDYIRKDFSKNLFELLTNSGLTEREFDIIIQYVGYDVSSKIICERYHIGHERLRQITVKALNKIKANPNIKELFDYAENPNFAFDFINRDYISYKIEMDFEGFSIREIEKAVKKLSYSERFLFEKYYRELTRNPFRPNLLITDIDYYRIAVRPKIVELLLSQRKNYENRLDDELYLSEEYSIPTSSSLKGNKSRKLINKDI